MADPSPAGARVLTFSVGDEAMGIPAAAVREIVPLPRLARVPHAPAALLGVANVRGEIVPVLSVARLAGRGESASRRIIVTDLDGPVGLAVTDVARIVDDRQAGTVPQLDIAALIAQAMPERQATRGPAMTVAPDRTAEAHDAALLLLAFRIGAQDFALDLAAVEEVLPLPAEIARLPDADAAAVGSIAVRDAVVPLLSLAALLALPKAPVTRRTRVILTRIGSHRVGLVVDAIRAIERVPEANIDAVHPVLNRGAETRIRAICRLAGRDELLSLLSPDHLLSEAFTAGMLQAQPESTPTMTSGPRDDADERFLIFAIGEARYALPIAAVQEVAQLPARLTPLPKAPAFVQGVMTLRGQVIPVIDQARRFDGAAVAGAAPRVIVVRIGDLVAGFSVDTVSRVARLPAEVLRPAPDFGPGGTRVFDRVASLDDGLVLVVSPQELLDRAERDLLAGLARESAGTGP